MVQELFGFLRDAAADGLRKGITDIGREVAKDARGRMATQGKKAIKTGLESFGRNGHAEGFETVGESGIKKWVVDLFKQGWGTFLITGDEGSGKTALSLVLADLMKKPTGKVFMVRAPATFEPHVERIDSTADIPHIGEGNVAIIDDAARFISSRRFMSEENLHFGDNVFEARHKGIITIINVQIAAAVDKYGLDNDALFVKKPIPFWDGTERPLLGTIMGEAARRFSQMDELEQKKWVFLFKDQAHHGWMSFSPPDWYTEKLSKFR